ncbi:MAG: hypothetical protein IPF84_04175 [Proteobacteria bacterium]|nr:hypothetical protein [Pseudomonadota bacterium]
MSSTYLPHDVVKCRHKTWNELSPQLGGPRISLWQSAAGMMSFLFNDAAYGISAPTNNLLCYAETVLASVGVGAGKTCANQNEPRRVCLPESGYFGYRHFGDSLILIADRSARIISRAMHTATH